MYKIGDYIVKSMNGVCKVEDILHLNMSEVDKTKLYYLLIPIEDKRAKIYMPTDTTDVTVREAMNEDEAWDLIKRIPTIDEMWIDNSKLREQNYKEVVKNCNLDDVVGIVKSTYNRKKKREAEGKKNTAVDERYLKMTENMLYSELAFALKKDKDEIYDIISTSIGDNQRNLVSRRIRIMNRTFHLLVYYNK